MPIPGSIWCRASGASFIHISARKGWHHAGLNDPPVRPGDPPANSGGGGDPTPEASSCRTVGEAPCPVAESSTMLRNPRGREARCRDIAAQFRVAGDGANPNTRLVPWPSAASTLRSTADNTVAQPAHPRAELCRNESRANIECEGAAAYIGATGYLKVRAPRTNPNRLALIPPSPGVSWPTPPCPVNSQWPGCTSHIRQGAESGGTGVEGRRCPRSAAKTRLAGSDDGANSVAVMRPCIKGAFRLKRPVDPCKRRVAPRQEVTAYATRCVRQALPPHTSREHFAESASPGLRAGVRARPASGPPSPGDYPSTHNDAAHL